MEALDTAGDSEKLACLAIFVNRICLACEHSAQLIEAVGRTDALC